MADGSSPTPAPAPAPAEPAQDWPAQAADLIVSTVGTVRDKTTGVAITAARWVVYGTFSALVALAVLVMLAIALVRFLDVYLPDAVFGEDHTWVAHALIGAVFTAAGMWCWSRRTRGDGG